MHQNPGQNVSDIAVGHDWDVKERREYERYSLDHYLRVIDAETNKQLGDVVDISLGGIRLLSNEALPKGQTLRLRFEIAMGAEYQAEVLFAARTVWCRNDIDPGFYTSGLKYDNLSPQAKASLQNLIRLLTESIDQPLS